MKNITFSKRIKAYIIDWVFIIILMSGLLCLIGTILVIIGELLNNNLLNFDILYFVILVGSVYIYPIFKDLTFSCGSIGCKIMKIKIVDQESGLRPTKKQLILRGFFFMVYPIDLIFVYKRLDNLSLSDIVTNTRVIYQFENDNVDIAKV